MNVWIKRSLSTAAVAGGLFFAGAAVANADTGTGSGLAENLTSSNLSAPIEIGSVDLGLTTQSSSSHSTAVTHTDRKGTTTSTKNSASTQKSTLGLSTGKIITDPAGTLSSVTRSTTDRSRHNTSGAASQHTKGSIKAPISIGGAKVTAQNEQSSTDSSKVVRTGKHGTSTSEQRNVHSSRTGGSLGTGAITLDPNGAVDTSKSIAGSSDRHGSKVSSSSATDVTGSLPISAGGLEAQGWSESYDANYRRTSAAGHHGNRTDVESNERASRTAAGLGVGRFVADPSAALNDRRSSLFETGRNGRYTLANDQATTGSLAAPFRFDGITGFVSSDQASRRVRGTEASDRRGTVSKVVTDEQASHQAIAGRSGAVTGNPALDFADHRSSIVAGDRDGSIVRSDRDGYATYALPYSYEGFGLLGDFGNASRRTAVEQVADHRGTTTRTETDEHANRTLPAYNFDGFRGAPQGDLELDRIAQLTQLDK